MPDLQGEHVVPLGCTKISKLSLKFFHKTDLVRALVFSESSSEESQTSGHEESDRGCDQVVSGPSLHPPSPGLRPPLPGLLSPCEKKVKLLPFVGLRNLGNTCYLNSILQVLFYCPGFIDGIKMMYLLERKKYKAIEEIGKSEMVSDWPFGDQSLFFELLRSFNSVITTVEQLRSRFLLNPNSFNKAELATTPRKILQTLQKLNPMYVGFCQHDAQEVLQCILGYILEGCDIIRKEQELKNDDVFTIGTKNIISLKSHGSLSEFKPPSEEDRQLGSKRKNDTDKGNAEKKKKKKKRAKKTDHVRGDVIFSPPVTRSRRKLAIVVKQESLAAQDKKSNTERSGEEDQVEKAQKLGGKGRPNVTFSQSNSSRNQQTISSKFCSVERIRSTSGKSQSNSAQDEEQEDKSSKGIAKEPPLQNAAQDKATKPLDDLGIMERLFQGRLVLRTRCLECENITERKEKFQDISVPVFDEQPSTLENFSEISPDPQPKLKTLKWAIGQFASVERLVGENKYFCEQCCRYTEAERTVLFDKTPEIFTIHLKRFSANSRGLDPYTGLCKVNTPLQTPLTLSLEEWCTNSMSSENQQYQLFAVVMHSGATISSGHYTSFIHMSDLKEMTALPEVQKGPKQHEHLNEIEAFFEGELRHLEKGVYIKVTGKEAKVISLSERTKLADSTVGLLGGKKSMSNYELGNDNHPEKMDSGETHVSKRRKTVNTSSQKTAAKEKLNLESPTPSDTLEFQGKWLLFDDVGVSLCEEEDFLRICSPNTCTSLTPYLLFYRRMPESQKRETF